MRKILAIGIAAFTLVFTCSVSQATSFLYQATGIVSYDLENQLFNDVDVLGSAMISDQPNGNMARPAYVYSPGIATMSYFSYNIDNFALGFDLGSDIVSEVGKDLVLYAEPSGNTVNISSRNVYPNSSLSWDRWEFLYLDGTPYNREIYSGNNLGDTDYGQLAPVIKLYITGTNANNDGGLPINGYILLTQVAPVPEPATILLLGAGLAGLACFTRKKKK